MAKNYDFRTELGPRLRDGLMDLADEWGIPMNEYVRGVLRDHVRRELSANQQQSFDQ